MAMSAWSSAILVAYNQSAPKYAAAVQFLHDNVPRYDLSSNPASKEVNLDVFGNGGSYAQGLLSAGAIFIGLGVVLFVVFMLSMLVSCWCCRKKVLKSDYDAAYGQRSFIRRMLGVRVFYLAIVVLLILIAFGALGTVPLLKAGFTAFVGGIVDMANILVDANGYMAGLPAQVAPLKTSADALVAAFNGPRQAANPAEYGKALYLQGIATTVQGVLSNNPLATVANQTSGLVLGTSDGGIDLTATSSMTASVSWGVIGGFAFVMLLLSASLIGTKLCACVRRSMAPCELVALLGVWIFTGIMLILALVLSDFCIAPGPTLIKLANTTGMPSMAVDTLQYYTSCPSNPAPIGAANITLQLEDILSYSHDLAAELNAATSTSASFAWASSLAADIAVNSDAPAWASANLSATLSCGSVYPPYMDAVTGLCRETTGGIYSLWALGVADAVFMVLLLSLATRMCRFHPGDVTNDDVVVPGANLKQAAVLTVRSAPANESAV